MQKNTFFLFSLLSLALVFSSCSKKDSDTQSNTGNGTTPLQQDTVTSFMVFFTNTVDSLSEVGGYDDPDGPGPKQGNVGGVALKANSSYKITFFIEDGTNPGKVVYLHNKIKNNGKEYKICISNPLGISVNAIDSDGTLPIGLENDMITTANTGDENLNFTIKYQKNTKNGECDPGVVYYTCNIPITIL